MNTLESYIATSPFDKEEECAKLVVDDTSVPFVLSDITRPNQEYTFSFWIRSDSDGSMQAYGTEFLSSDVWKKHALTFIAGTVDLEWWFGLGTYYIYHPQLEIGNKATDWTPAPEDIEQSVDDTANDIHNTILEQVTSITNTCEELILQAGKNYTEVGNFETFKESVEAQLSVMAEQISMNFTDTIERLESVNGDLQSQLNTITQHFTFSINGLTIGQSNKPSKVVIDEDIISILMNDVEVQRFDADGNALIPALRILKSLEAFGYLTYEEDGIVNCEYIGG